MKPETKTSISLLIVFSLFLISAVGAVFAAGWTAASFIIYLAKDVEMSNAPIAWTIGLSLAAIFLKLTLSFILFTIHDREAKKKSKIVTDKFQEAVDRKLAETRAANRV